MKFTKTACAFAALAAAGTAWAQSSVTLFGSMDLALRRVQNQAASTTGLAPDGRGNSRLGFRGVEDLGGGLAAEFWLEAQITPDTGGGGGTGGLTFRRRSTVALRSDAWGELRLGRDYTPTFYGVAAYDPFGHNGVGLISNVDPHGPLATFVRSDNAISYFLPPLVPGLVAQVMVAPSENTANAGYRGARIGYTSGSLDLRASMGQQYIDVTKSGARFETWTLGGKYDFGVATMNANFIRENLEATAFGIAPGSYRHWMLGTVVPVGLHEFKASYNRGEKAGGSARQIAVGYAYNLSKRTSLYMNLSHLQNSGNFDRSVDQGLPNGATPQLAGGRSRGTEFGILHNF